MNRLFEALIDLLFPPKCPFCGRLLDGIGICADCERDLPWVPEEKVVSTNGDVTCAAPLWYQDAVREALLRLKFRGGSALAEPLGEVLARCAAEQFGGEFDTVTWVPVSGKRLRKRGYDQARLLAEAACRRWDTKPLALLKKTQDNPPQSGLSGESARRANVLGVYEPTDADLTGRRVLLIDDICTTGTTLAECVRVLLDAGAASVVCLTAARAPDRPAAKKGKNS